MKYSEPVVLISRTYIGGHDILPGEDVQDVIENMFFDKDVEMNITQVPCVTAIQDNQGIESFFNFLEKKNTLGAQIDSTEIFPSYVQIKFEDIDAVVCCINTMYDPTSKTFIHINISVSIVCKPGKKPDCPEETITVSHTYIGANLNLYKLVRKKYMPEKLFQDYGK